MAKTSEIFSPQRVAPLLLPLGFEVEFANVDLQEYVGMSAPELQEAFTNEVDRLTGTGSDAQRFIEDDAGELSSRLDITADRNVTTAPDDIEGYGTISYGPSHSLFIDSPIQINGATFRQSLKFHSYRQTLKNDEGEITLEPKTIGVEFRAALPDLPAMRVTNGLTGTIVIGKPKTGRVASKNIYIREIYSDTGVKEKHNRAFGLGVEILKHVDPGLLVVATEQTRKEI